MFEHESVDSHTRAGGTDGPDSRPSNSLTPPRHSQVADGGGSLEGRVGSGSEGRTGLVVQTVTIVITDVNDGGFILEGSWVWILPPLMSVTSGDESLRDIKTDGVRVETFLSVKLMGWLLHR